MSDKEKDGKAPKKKMARGKFWGIVGGAVVVVAIAGAGLWHWHEQPSFCAAFCHNMDQHLATYEQEPHQAGIDKYGNAVANVDGLMSVAHKDVADAPCMDCHHPIVQDQITEVLETVSGDYYDPLSEATLSEMTVHWPGDDYEQFCANENCHSDLLGSDGKLDRSKLMASTESYEFNPHDTYHEAQEMECSTCHKGHRASVHACTSCHEHEDVELPEGWVTWEEGQQVLEKTFAKS